MQVIAVIAESEKDFIKSILGQETSLSKNGGVLIHGFLYKPICHRLQVMGTTFNGVMITEKAKENNVLKVLFHEVLTRIKI